MQSYKDIDAYIAEQPLATIILLEQLREAIRQAAPQATECISYGMPAFELHGKLVYFAAYKNHIGFYPMPQGIAAFQEDLASYKTSKGTVQFDLNKEIPLDLVTKITKFRAAQNLEKFALKTTKK